MELLCKKCGGSTAQAALTIEIVPSDERHLMTTPLGRIMTTPPGWNGRTKKTIARSEHCSVGDAHSPDSGLHSLDARRLSLSRRTRWPGSSLHPRNPPGALEKKTVALQLRVGGLSRGKMSDGSDPGLFLPAAAERKEGLKTVLSSDIVDQIEWHV